jgi:hypothetical protein
MSQTQILLWCIALIVLELNHLKWIWWTYWECAKCGRKHKDCDCGSKWVMFPTLSNDSTGSSSTSTRSRPKTCS